MVKGGGVRRPLTRASSWSSWEMFEVREIRSDDFVDGECLDTLGAADNFADGAVGSFFERLTTMSDMIFLLDFITE